MQQYLSKGSLVGIDGRLQSRTYEGKDGKTVFVTEVLCDSVQFLESKKERESGQQTQNYGGTSAYQAQTKPQEQRGQNTQAHNNTSGPVDIQDDDLPF